MTGQNYLDKLEAEIDQISSCRSRYFYNLPPFFWRKSSETQYLSHFTRVYALSNDLEKQTANNALEACSDLFFNKHLLSTARRAIICSYLLENYEAVKNNPDTSDILKQNLLKYCSTPENNLVNELNRDIKDNGRIIVRDMSGTPRSLSLKSLMKGSPSSQITSPQKQRFFPDSPDLRIA